VLIKHPSRSPSSSTSSESSTSNSEDEGNKISDEGQAAAEGSLLMQKLTKQLLARAKAVEQALITRTAKVLREHVRGTSPLMGTFEHRAPVKGVLKPPASRTPSPGARSRSPSTSSNKSKVRFEETTEE